MSHYLQIAKGIHTWLAGLQVQPDLIQADIVDDQLRFGFVHPVEGRISVQEKISRDRVFSAHGVALRLVKLEKDNAELEVVDAGGIFDPIDGRVQGEHYSASHFALLSAILFCETQDQAYLSSAKKAIAFHLRTSPTEYAPISTWMYHWDFQNYAFILTFRMLKGFLSEEERRAWKKGIKSWGTNYKNKLTNWAAMRAWACAERYVEFGNPLDSWKVNWNLRTVKKVRSGDGCFDDNFGLSRPIQYHVFTVAILHRILLLRKDQQWQQWFDDGIAYLVPFIDPEGDFNYVGRGQEQIFGYASAIYALEAAYKKNGDKNHLNLAHRLFDFLLKYQKGNYFPLVLNESLDEERNGWYDYHHLTVYNAFLGAWLALTHLLKNPVPTKSPERRSYFWVSQPTHTAIFSNENYFAAFYGGLPEYLCEPGITPQHLWWRELGVVFSCPGGPSQDRFGQRSPQGSEKNFLAPIAKNSSSWYLPASKKSDSFDAREDSIVMKYDYSSFRLNRIVRFDAKTIFFEDEIEFLSEHHFDDFRFFNFPIPAGKFDINIVNENEVKLTSERGSLSLHVFGCELPFQILETIPTAKGWMRLLVKHEQDFRAQKGEKRKLQFRLGQ